MPPRARLRERERQEISSYTVHIRISASHAIIAAVLAAIGSVTPPPVAAAAPRPNVIFVLADDLGYGDLSSYGATDIATPNIDRLGHEGVRFTSFYAAANTCSPSRAALLTGRYPPRSGVNAVLFHDSPEGLPASEITIAELLRDAGYQTAMVGKWHLGNTDEFMPWSHGFTEFFGVAHSNDQANFFVYDGRRRIPEAVDQSLLLRRYTDRAVDFIGRAARAGQPFFLYFAANAPHIPLYPSAEFAGHSRRGTYGDVVEELDASVGKLLAKVTEVGIDDDTLVIFSSDNGPWLAMRDWGGNAGPLRGGKTGTFEGGHRVPAAARWPGKIRPGIEARDLADMMDWLPTLVELAGARLPDDRVIDGRSLTPVLLGTGAREATPFFYLRLRSPFSDQHHEIGAVRDGRWKLKLAQSGYPAFLEPLMKTEFYRHGVMLFDLEADVGEQNDVAAEHPDVVDRLTKSIAAFDASLAPATPVQISAAPQDHTGWEKMWRGVAITAVLVFGSLAMLLFVILRFLRRLLRRRRLEAMEEK